MEQEQRTQIIDKVLAKIRDKGMFHPIQRFRYDSITADDGLAIMDAIGKARDTRFVIDKENRFAFENIIKWVHGDTSALALHPDSREQIPANMKAGIYIAGNTGTGKSWCFELVREYILAMGFEIIVDDTKRTMSYQIARADEINAVFMADGTIERFKQADLLCIQDVGSESRETLYMGNRIEVIRALMEWRGDNPSKMTFITSNYPMTHPQFVERYGDRVASRMREMCNYYEIKGKDRRKQ